MNKQLRTILVLLSGLTLVFAAGCQKKTVTATTEPVIPVKVQAVTTGKVTEAVDYAVIVEPLAQASISPKISGRVQSIPVGLGTYVHKGETLIQLDPTDYQIQLQQAKANLAKAQADFETSEGNGPARAQVAYDLARKNYERYKSLYDQGLVSKAQYESALLELEQARANLKSTQANLAGAKAAVEQAETQLAETRVVAPVSGFVTMIGANAGEMVSPGVPIVAVADLSQVYAVANVGQSVIATLAKGTQVSVNFDINGKNTTVMGKVVELSYAADTITKTYKVKILLNNPEQLLKGGMIGKATFALRSTAPGALVVPRETVLQEDGKLFVYLVDANGRAVKRTVTLGLTDGKMVEVRSGLKPGDKLVVSGQHRLQPSVKVKVN